MKKKLTYEQEKAMAESRAAGAAVKTLALRYGINTSSVSRIAKGFGLTPPVRKKQRIIDYLDENPCASFEDIAQAAGSTAQSVRQVLSAIGWTRQHGTAALGRAAQEAGLTVADIRAFKREARA